MKTFVPLMAQNKVVWRAAATAEAESPPPALSREPLRRSLKPIPYMAEGVEWAFEIPVRTWATYAVAMCWAPGCHSATRIVPAY